MFRQFRAESRRGQPIRCPVSVQSAGLQHQPLRRQLHCRRAGHPDQVAAELRRLRAFPAEARRFSHPRRQIEPRVRDQPRQMLPLRRDQPIGWLERMPLLRTLHHQPRARKPSPRRRLPRTNTPRCNNTRPNPWHRPRPHSQSPALPAKALHWHRPGSHPLHRLQASSSGRWPRWS